MRRLFTAILAIGIALVFLVYMVTYTVNYNEIAIITTFDKATDPDPDALANKKDSGSVIVQPGLKFKWPWPIQRVQTYPTQLQVLQDTPEQLLLSDGNTIIINMSLTWRINDPLAFSKSHGSMDEAQDKLKAQMRSLRSIISKNYGLGDLVSTEENQVKLDELENQMAQKLREQLSAIKPSFGVEVADVTVGKMLYTASTADSVNQRMTSAQEGKATKIRQEGISQAETIRKQAESRSQTLEDFAQTVVSRIEVVGENEANAIIARYSEAGGNEGLAIYLRQLEALEQILSNRTTFVLDARTFTPLDVLVYGHGGPDNLSRLFNKAEEDTTSIKDLPTPVAPQSQAEHMREQIHTLEQRLKDLSTELEALRAAPVPVRTISIDSRTEDRP